MANDKFERFSHLYDEIGHEVLHIVGDGGSDAYLYAEVEQGVVYAGVFKDEGKAVRYFDPSLTLCDVLMKLWEAEELSKRWAVLKYGLVGKKVHAELQYAEDLRHDEGEVERRQRALDIRYGDKKVIYPPVPHH